MQSCDLSSPYKSVVYSPLKSTTSMNYYLEKSNSKKLVNTYNNERTQTVTDSEILHIAKRRKLDSIKESPAMQIDFINDCKRSCYDNKVVLNEVTFFPNIVWSWINILKINCQHSTK